MHGVRIRFISPSIIREDYGNFGHRISNGTGLDELILMIESGLIGTGQ